MNQPIDICLFVHNHVMSDSRMLKEATSLTEHGWKVRVVGQIDEYKRIPEAMNHASGVEG